MPAWPSPEFLLLHDSLEVSLSASFPDGLSRAVATLRQMAGMHQPQGLPLMLGWIHHANATIREAAEDAVDSMMKLLPPRMLPELEGVIRQSWMRYTTRETTARAQRVGSLLLATLDPSGRHREYALKHLLDSADGRILPFALLRLNDWVPAVRRLADDWMARHAHKLPLPSVAAAIPVIAAVASRLQGSASGQLNALASRLRKPEAVPYLLELLPSSETRSRRFIFEQLATGGTLSDPAIQEALLRGSDPFVGVMCLHLLEKNRTPVSPDVLRLAVSSGTAMLRAKALALWQAQGVSGFFSLLESHLLDSSPTIRQFARYWIEQECHGYDFVQRYQSAMEAETLSRNTAAAFAGYHECGGRLRATDYADWLKHDTSLVRRSALKCFAQVFPAEAGPVVRTLALEGHDPALSKTAFELIRSHRSWLSLEDITMAVTGEAIAQTKLRAMSLLRRGDKWRQLPVLLRLLARDRDEIQPVAKAALRDWMQRYNLTWTQPFLADLIEARRCLAVAGCWLGRRERLDLENLLSTVTCR